MHVKNNTFTKGNSRKAEERLPLSMTPAYSLKLYLQQEQQYIFNTQACLIHVKHALACRAISHLSKYLDGVLFCGVTKHFLPLAKNNLQLRIACHGIHYAVGHKDLE